MWDENLEGVIGKAMTCVMGFFHSCQITAGQVMDQQKAVERNTNHQPRGLSFHTFYRLGPGDKS